MRGKEVRTWLIVLLLQALVALSPAVSATEYPVLEYWVTDQVGVLFQSEVADIESNCIEVFEAKGAEMVVLIVNTTQPDGIDTFAVKTFEENGFGQEDRDDGLLIVVSVSEHTWRVEVGYGLEGVLPDALVGRIADEHLVPFLNESDYYQGLLYTTAFLGREILDNYEGDPVEEESPYPISWLPCTTWQLVLLVVFLILVVATKGRIVWWLPYVIMGRGGGGGRSWGGGRSGGGGASGTF